MGQMTNTLTEGKQRKRCKQPLNYEGYFRTQLNRITLRKPHGKCATEESGSRPDSVRAVHNSCSTEIYRVSPDRQQLAEA